MSLSPINCLGLGYDLETCTGKRRYYRPLPALNNFSSSSYHLLYFVPFPLPFTARFFLSPSRFSVVFAANIHNVSNPNMRVLNYMYVYVYVYMYVYMYIYRYRSKSKFFPFYCGFTAVTAIITVTNFLVQNSSMITFRYDICRLIF